MPAIDGQFEVKPLLDALRAERGDAEFGYRMQGMFAHVLLRMGAEILEVNAQGHPDIKARLGGDLLLVQVKSCDHAHASSMFQLSSADLAGIGSSHRTKGYLAFLDCAVPVSWHVVDASVVWQFLGRCVPVATLRAARDEQMSQDSTQLFVELILGVKERLSLLTFPLLAQRALQGRQA